jgi:hypothetical protein
MRHTKDERIQKLSDFYCTYCGNKGIPILRTNKAREPGHLKKMFCLYCQKENNMVEIKQNGKYTLEDFLLEFQNGNFENGERKLPYKQFISELRKKECKK